MVSLITSLQMDTGPNSNVYQIFMCVRHAHLMLKLEWTALSSVAMTIINSYLQLYEPISKKPEMFLNLLNDTEMPEAVNKARN